MRANMSANARRSSEEWPPLHTSMCVSLKIVPPCAIFAELHLKGNEQNVPKGHSVSGSDRCSARTRKYQGDQTRYEALTHRFPHFRRSAGQPATDGEYCPPPEADHTGARNHLSRSSDST